MTSRERRVRCNECNGLVDIRRTYPARKHERFCERCWEDKIRNETRDQFREAVEITVQLAANHRQYMRLRKHKGRVKKTR
jgi:hypothetical protein